MRFGVGRAAVVLVAAAVAIQLHCAPVSGQAPTECVPYPSQCDWAIQSSPLPCDGYFTPNLVCIRTKGLPANLPGKNGEYSFPSAAVNFTVSKYSFDPDDCQYAAFNVSWKLNIESGSMSFLKGFILHVVNASVSDPQPINITRYFNLTFNTWDSRDALKQVEIHYPCIVANYIYGAQYLITLQSVPVDIDNVVRTYISVPPLVRPGPCYFMADVTVDLSLCTAVRVDFSVGPLLCNFSQYIVQLVYSNVESSNNNVADRIVVNASAILEETTLRAVFTNVTAGIYYVWIQPAASYINSNCICHYTDNLPGGCDDCPITTAGPFVVSCVKPTRTSSALPPSSTAKQTTTSPPSLSPGSVVGICIGIVIAVAVLFVVLYLIFRNRPGGHPDPDPDPEKPRGKPTMEEQSEKPPVVWVVYLQETEKQKKLVDLFSGFIKSHVSCELEEVNISGLLDYNFNCEIVEFDVSRLLDYKTKWDLVKHVIIIIHDMSSTSDALQLQSQYGAFMKAVEAFQRQEEQCGSKKLIFVSFKVRDRDEFPGVRIGRKFQLVWYLSEFVEAIRCGPDDYSCHGDCGPAKELVSGIFLPILVPPDRLPLRVNFGDSSDDENLSVLEQALQSESASRV